MGNDVIVIGKTAKLQLELYPDRVNPGALRLNNHWLKIDGFAIDTSTGKAIGPKAISEDKLDDNLRLKVNSTLEDVRYRNNKIFGDINANNHTIKNLKDPIDDKDPIRKIDFENHTQNTTIHYQKSDIKHSDIQDDEPEKHRVIEDTIISSTGLYSSQKIEERLATKADNKDYPLKWQIVDFIQDGSVIDSNPSANGYNTAGEIYAISDSGNIYNGNVYRVSDSDTWELLETRSKGLGVLKSSDLKEYYYSSDDGNGQWNNYFNNYESHMGKTFFDNLLKNGEMEFWIDANTPKNWKEFDDGSSGSYVITKESNIVRYGSYSLKLEISQAFTNWGCGIFQVDEDGVSAYTIKTHGVETQWRFKSKIRASVANALFLSIDVKINGTWNYDYIVGTTNNTINDWEDLSLVFTSQSDWEEIVFKVRILDNITGTFYIDTAFAYNGFVDIGYMGKSSEGNSGGIESIDDVYIDIDTDADSDENNAPNKVIIRKHKNNSPVDVFSIDEKGKTINIITGKAILTPATYIIDKSGYGDYTNLQSCLDYIAGDIQNRKGLIHIRKDDYTNFGEITFDNSITWEDILIEGEGNNTKISNITAIFWDSGNTNYIKNLTIQNLYVKMNNAPYALRFDGQTNNYDYFFDNISFLNIIAEQGSVEFRGVKNSFMFNVKVIEAQSPQSGMFLSDVYNTAFQNCYTIHSGTVAGFRMNDGHGYTKYNTFQNCYALDGVRGFYMENLYNNVFENNQFIGCQANNNSGNDYEIKDNGNQTKNKIISCNTDGIIRVGGNRNIIKGCSANEIQLQGSNHLCNGNIVDTITDNSTGSDVSHNI